MSEEDKKPVEDIESKAEEKKDAEGQLAQNCSATSWNVCYAGNNMNHTLRCGMGSQSTCGQYTCW